MIKRELYLKKIRPFIGKNIVKVLTGIRRCGKSVMLELIKDELISQGADEKRILSVNFESGPSAALRTPEDVYKHVQKFADSDKSQDAASTLSLKKIYLFFDEIQELKGWETLINSCMIDFDADIYITGSNAYLLSGELATYLGGRYVEFKIYPFSFAEVMESSKQNDSETDVKALFQAYLIRGGMPFIHQFPFEENAAVQYLSDIYDSIILKDIASRYQVRDIELLKRIIMYFIANTGNTFSSSQLSKYLKSEMRSVSTETIYNYIDYCRSACLLHLVGREDVIGKKMLKFQEKMYIADHGIRQALLGRNLQDINQVLENIVYMELLRRGYEVTVGRNGDREIDFCAVRSGEKIYIQAAYILTDDSAIEREFSVLEQIPDNYPKYVVTMDEINRGRNGIPNVNIRDFLLTTSL